ncbi:hypothetical protein [Agrobacterium vitis]|uniref:hypothetical protein n=1 Tax=Agrobacterium vitis TaxID=373 RepID=UPI001572E0D2|nr:hypothetical protein [Agrobacterium vitis]QZO03079.1 hypothetical protein K4831_11555 [Agrobacterium vitis]UJL88200.1 hypothetical protein AVF2S5_09895 [Agrobacterium vitis]
MWLLTLSRFKIAAPICFRRIEDVAEPPLPEREQLLYNIAYAHWTPEEIRGGEIWVRSLPFLPWVVSGAADRPQSRCQFSAAGAPVAGTVTVFVFCRRCKGWNGLDRSPSNGIEVGELKQEAAMS